MLQLGIAISDGGVVIAECQICSGATRACACKRRVQRKYGVEIPDRQIIGADFVPHFGAAEIMKRLLGIKLDRQAKAGQGGPWKAQLVE
jgi:hypothetical protein